ncbi:permease [Lentibacillus salinarum]|uniref:Permease n=1 Tax=Lentibacillus salinarum TaxID=446820 RepID=A0ABW3ZZJ9_9BACI
MNKDYMPRTYFILGILFLLMSGFLIVIAIMANAAPVPMTYMCITFTVVAFSASYLYPQLRQKDERAKMIRQKGMFYSFFALLIYLIVLTFLIGNDIVPLDAMDVLNILVSLTISTVFISWVILAKRY